ncbi:MULTISPECIES: hypothetical protein [Leucobacter]|uniref:Uncharacterized protein n=1 Tax=Leucobacter chromiiresistens TaxID=1079994 RepID=A0A1H0YKQ3_9MICO|nr:hypothetical protein [Leucobacter chromiiresistens]SDQ15466.1 hypothetical protein SAMN04488565_0944 [Leucobacter chromiiresistens]
MSNTPIVRQRMRFEDQYGTHRNWWVRDPRVTGLPIALFLYMQSHAENFEVTPAKAKRDLGLTDYAWKTAKNTLRRYGFFLEVRDRWPAGSVAPMMRDGSPILDRKGQPRYTDLTGNLRVRVFTQDPDENVDLGPDGGVIEVDEPYELWLEKQNELLSRAGAQRPVEPTFTAPRISHSGDGTAPRNSHPGEEHQVSTAPRDSHSGVPVDEIRTTPIKEEENQGWLVGSQSSIRPTNQTTRDAEIDAELEALAPGCGLTLAAVEREIQGRVDLAGVDVVQATRDTLLRASGRVNKPASYIASVIVRYPEKWAVGGDGTAPFDPAPAADAFASESPVAACLRGEHWWGSERLREIERSHCPDCGEPRRNVDPAFAALEAGLLAIGSDH